MVIHNLLKNFASSNFINIVITNWMPFTCWSSMNVFVHSSSHSMCFLRYIMWCMPRDNSLSTKVHHLLLYLLPWPEKEACNLLNQILKLPFINTIFTKNNLSHMSLDIAKFLMHLRLPNHVGGIPNRKGSIDKHCGVQPTPRILMISFHFLGNLELFKNFRCPS